MVVMPRCKYCEHGGDVKGTRKRGQGGICSTEKLRCLCMATKGMN